MDGHQFDQLVRTLPTSRRAVLSLGAGLGLRPLFADAKKHRKKRKQKRKCPSGTKACNGQCIPDAACCTQQDCPSGRFCQHGGCFTGCTNAEPTNCLVGGCNCRVTVAGPKVCATAINCVSVQPCADDSGCPLGQTCVASGCCTSFGKPRYCQPPD